MTSQAVVSPAIPNSIASRHSQHQHQHQHPYPAPVPSTNADPPLLGFLPFLDASRRCEQSRFLAKTSAYHPPHPLILLTTFDRFKPSGNINPLLTPPPSSRYGPASSKTKHPKGWAATLSAKRLR